MQIPASALAEVQVDPSIQASAEVKPENRVLVLDAKFEKEFLRAGLMRVSAPIPVSWRHLIDSLIECYRHLITGNEIVRLDERLESISGTV